MTEAFTCSECGTELPILFGVWLDDFGRLIEAVPNEENAGFVTICFRCKYEPQDHDVDRIMPTQPFIRRRIEHQRNYQRGKA